MARLRTIRQAIVELRRQDPATALTESALRMLVHTGALASVAIGSRRLIDLDALES